MIHIYNRNGKYKVSLNYTKEEFKKNWYDAWEDGDIVVEQKLNNPIVDNGELREMTKQEMVEAGIEVSLDEGEIIEGKKIITIPKPSKYHTWDGVQWHVDLDEVKKLKREELKKIRKEKQNEDFEFQGHIFQATENDMRNIETKYNAITMLDKLGQDIKPFLNKKIKWTLKDNTQIDMLVSDILQLYIAWDTRRTKVFEYCNNVLYKQLDEAQTVEEIEKIAWNAE